MKVVFGARSDIGLSRQFNEDCYLVDEDLGLFVVADGMGGSAGGEIASRMACNEIHNSIRRGYDIVRKLDAGKSDVSTQAVADFVTGAVQQACAAVHAQSQKDRSLAGMGTTVAMILVSSQHIFLAHVGDSRIYVFRPGQEAHQLTRDHSLVEELKKLGKISSSKQVRAKYRNAITRAVGIYENVQVDILEMVPMPGDRFLICSDGLHSTASKADLQRLVAEIPPDEAAEKLVRHANSKGGKDNITCILLDIAQVEQEKAELTQRKLSTLKAVPLFKYLTFDELLKVVSMVSDRSFEAGETIVVEGEPGNALFVIMAGEVDVKKGDEKISRLKSGDHFGELSLLDRYPRSASVLARNPVQCLVMSQDQFYGLIRQYNALSVKLLWSLARVCSVRLRETTDELGLVKSLIAQVNLKDDGPELFPGDREHD